MAMFLSHGLLFGTPRPLFFGVVGLFFGPLGKTFLESWAFFLEPQASFWGVMGLFFGPLGKTKLESWAYFWTRLYVLAIFLVGPMAAIFLGGPRLFIHLGGAIGRHFNPPLVRSLHLTPTPKVQAWPGTKKEAHDSKKKLPRGPKKRPMTPNKLCLWGPKKRHMTPKKFCLGVPKRGP